MLANFLAVIGLVAIVYLVVAFLIALSVPIDRTRRPH